MDDFINFNKFVLKLRNSDNPVSQFLQDQLEEFTKALLSAYDEANAPSEELQSALIEGLNEVLQGPFIYEANRFSGVELRVETEQLRTQDSEGEDIIRLNRLLTHKK